MTEAHGIARPIDHDAEIARLRTECSNEKAARLRAEGRLIDSALREGRLREALMTARSLLAQCGCDYRRLAPAIDAALAAASTAPVWRHKTRGTTYTIIADGEFQSAVETFDGVAVTIYRSTTDGRVWARASDEFYDGRFELADR